jgi:predicted MarR family transcription regulator
MTLLARPDVSKTDARVWLALAVVTRDFPRLPVTLANIAYMARVDDAPHVARSLKRLRAAGLYDCERTPDGVVRWAVWPANGAEPGRRCS